MIAPTRILLEPWAPPAPGIDLEESANWPDSVFANPLKRRGPLLNARFVSLVIRCFDVFADNDTERELAYSRLVEAARHFRVPLAANSWRDLSANRSAAA
jgi:hypothetical protein